MKVIGMAHTMLHESGVVRIQTDIRVGSRYASIEFDSLRMVCSRVLIQDRIDKKQSFGEKVTSVNNLLAKDEKV